jgi:hypothetical protein
MTQEASEIFHDGIPFIMEGQVVSNTDPDQMGRVKIWVPAMDGENFVVDQLPWAEYASPFMGFTVEYPAGNGTSNNKAHAAYGFWAIPKIGATVLVFCLNANPAARFYFASTTRLHRNRSLPAGRNTDYNGKPGPFGDDGDEAGNLTPLQPAYDNLRRQFRGGEITDPIAKTRGAWERQVAQHKDDKDGNDGYAKSPADSSHLDPQTYCITTPGRHAIIMQDDPKGSRIRFKTAEGHQIIFDDTNERIYMSTSEGNSWVELDRDGHIHVFSSKSISFRAEEDINISANRNINIEAKKAINIRAIDEDIRIGTGASLHIKAYKDIKQSACGIFDIDCESAIKITATNNLDIKSGADLALTSTRNTHVLAGAGLIQTAARIDQNGPQAKQAEAATCPEKPIAPPIIPGVEPWQGRPLAKRNANYIEKKL